MQLIIGSKQSAHQLPCIFLNIASEYPKYIPEGPWKTFTFFVSTLNVKTPSKHSEQNKNDTKTNFAIVYIHSFVEKDFVMDIFWGTIFPTSILSVSSSKCQQLFKMISCHDC